MSTKLFRESPFIEIWSIEQTNDGYKINQTTEDEELFYYYVAVGRKIGFLKPRKNRAGHIVLNMEKVSKPGWYFEFGGQLEVFEVAKSMFEINGRRSDRFDRITEGMANFCMEYIWERHILELESLARFETRRCVRPYTVIPRYYLLPAYQHLIKPEIKL